jgi:uncharacterized membrane protein YgcG
MQSITRKMLPSLAIVAVSLTVMLMAGCSSSKELSSNWTNQELAITGDVTHWTDATTDIVGPDVSIGVKNDKNNLYVGLVTANRVTQYQILGLGCTVWFDTEGKKAKTCGIQFPVSGLLQGRRFPTRENPEELQRLINLAQRQLVLIGPGEQDRRRITPQDAAGIEGHVGYADGVLTLELKVPLQKSDRQTFAANADPAKPLFLGFETGDIAEVMKGQPGSSSPSQSAGGGGGGRGRSGGRSGGGGASPGLGNEMPEPLKHWFSVHLSTGTAAK